MKTRIKSWLFLLAVVMGMASLVATRAAADDEPEQDPPGRVARLSYVNGQVSFSPSGTEDWVAAVVNRPKIGRAHV